MDRQIVYPGQILPETTLLQMTKDALIGLGKLSAAVLGTGTVINGFAVTPTGPASLQVVAAPGEVYSLQNIDSTAFSSLAADTAHQIVKQGLLLDAATLACPAPGASGQSINYLIQVAYQDVDSSPSVLPYYNSSAPAQPYSGQGNNGQSQNTVRKGGAVVQAKAGVAATTGTQTTPAPDSGYVGAYVVTVAYGQTQITAGNIAAYSGAPFVSETLQQKAGQVGFQQDLYSSAIASGTADAIAASFTPAFSAVTLASGCPAVSVRATAANATDKPTFTPAPGVIAAAAIVKGNGLPLAAGDIAGAGHWITLQWDATLSKWVLLNPATGVTASNGLAASGVNALNATTTLTAAAAGATTVLYGAAAITLTLPAASSVSAGKRIEILSIATATASVSRAGTDTISGNSSNATSVSMGNGDTLTLESNGSNTWYVIAGTAGFQFSAVMKAAGSMSTPGYRAFPAYPGDPAPLVLQWGAGTTSAGIQSITFPTTFPNQIFGAFAIAAQTGNFVMQTNAQSVNSATFAACLGSSGAAVATSFNWFAWGR